MRAICPAHPILLDLIIIITIIIDVVTFIDWIILLPVLAPNIEFDVFKISIIY